MLAIVLTRQDFRENDQVISLFTLEGGKIEVLARGLKKILSKNSASLEPGSLVEAEIIPGKKEVSHLGSVQLVENFSSLRQKLASSAVLAWSLNLVDQLLHPRERDDRMFKMLLGWIKFLDNDFKEFQPVLLADIFAVKVLKLLGFDIFYEKKVDPGQKNNLEVLANGKWDAVEEKKLDKEKADSLHVLVYKFFVYHTEKQWADWDKLAYLSLK